MYTFFFLNEFASSGYDELFGSLRTNLDGI